MYITLLFLFVLFFPLFFYFILFSFSCGLFAATVFFSAVTAVNGDPTATDTKQNITARRATDDRRRMGAKTGVRPNGAHREHHGGSPEQDGPAAAAQLPHRAPRARVERGGLL